MYIYYMYMYIYYKYIYMFIYICGKESSFDASMAKKDQELRQKENELRKQLTELEQLRKQALKPFETIYIYNIHLCSTLVLYINIVYYY